MRRHLVCGWGAGAGRGPDSLRPRGRGHEYGDHGCSRPDSPSIGLVFDAVAARPRERGGDCGLRVCLIHPIECRTAGSSRVGLAGFPTDPVRRGRSVPDSLNDRH